MRKLVALAVLSVSALFAARATADVFPLHFTGAAVTNGGGTFNLGDTDGTADGSITIDALGNISWNITYNNIATPPTAFHILAGTPSQNNEGGVFIVDLGTTGSVITPNVQGTLVGSTTTKGSKAQQMLFAPESYYLEIHNASFPSGGAGLAAVRTQLVFVPEPGMVGLGLVAGALGLLRRSRQV